MSRNLPNQKTEHNLIKKKYIYLGIKLITLYFLLRNVLLVATSFDAKLVFSIQILFIISFRAPWVIPLPLSPSPLSPR